MSSSIPVVYFTSGPSATTDEKNDISSLQQAFAHYGLYVQNGGMLIENTTDYPPSSNTILVGTIPAVYEGLYTSSTVSALISGSGSGSGGGGGIPEFTQLYLIQNGYPTQPLGGPSYNQTPISNQYHLNNSNIDDGTNAVFIASDNIHNGDNVRNGVWFRGDRCIVSDGQLIDVADNGTGNVYNGGILNNFNSQEQTSAGLTFAVDTAAIVSSGTVVSATGVSTGTATLVVSGGILVEVVLS